MSIFEKIKPLCLAGLVTVAGAETAWSYTYGSGQATDNAIISWENSADTITSGNCEMDVTISDVSPGTPSIGATVRVEVEVTASGSGSSTFQARTDEEFSENVYSVTCDGEPGKIALYAPDPNETDFTASFIPRNYQILSSSTPMFVGARNDRPVAILASTAQVAGDGSTLALSGSATDEDFPGSPASSILSGQRWSATTPGAPALVNSTTLTPTFPGETLAEGAANKDYTYQLVVYDNNGVASTPKSITITVEAPDDTTPPTALPGANSSVASGAAGVMLDGSGSTDNVGITTYAWTSSDGILLSGANTATPTFDAPIVAAGEDDRDLTFTLTVTDAAGNSANNSVTVTVRAEPDTINPYAFASATNMVSSGTTGVMLDGGASFDNVGITSYAWTAPDGITLTGANTATPTFDAPTVPAGQANRPLAFTLTVTDAAGNSANSGVTVLVIAEPDTAAPTANAGADRTVASGTAGVALDGLGSSDNVGIETYAWTAPDGITLTGADTETPTFDAPTVTVGQDDRDLTFTLTVTDAVGNSAEDSVIITVSAEPDTTAPTANAGADRTVASGTAGVALDGSGSSDNVGITSYAWTAPDGVTLTGADTATPSFDAPTIATGEADRDLTFTLTVTDAAGSSAEDSVTVTVSTEPDTAAPTANAGADRSVASGTASVALDGSGSTDNVGITSYAWASPEGIALTGSDTATPSFDAPTVAAGEADRQLGFTLTVTDAEGNSAQDTVTITVTAAADTAAPTANAGADRTVASGTTGVALDGAGSSDDVGIVTYAWTAPDGIALTEVNGPSPSFDAPTIATGAEDRALTFTLTVTDAAGNSAEDSVTITVKAAEDTVAPAPPTDETTSITPNPDGSITVSGTTEPGATVRVTFPDGSRRSVVAAANGRFAITSVANQPSGSVAIQVVDQTGNASEVFARAFVAGPTVEEIQTEIAGYMQARAGLVARAQPDLTGLLSGTVGGAFNANATEGQGSFNFVSAVSPGGQPVWARLQGNWSETGSHKNSYFFGAVGGHVQLSSNALMGVMLQFDKLSQTSGDTKTEGSGYLAGPYIVAKLPSQPLYFEGRYLVGRTENSVSVDGATAEEFDTDRSLASVKVSGRVQTGDLTLMPSLTATRVHDRQKAFTDSAGRFVGEQSITTTDVAAGLDFAKYLAIDSGTLLLTGGISGIWSETEGSGFAQTLTSDFDGARGRVKLGVSYTMDNGVVWTAGASYDGIGADDYSSIGLNLGVEMKF